MLFEMACLSSTLLCAHTDHTDYVGWACGTASAITSCKEDILSANWSIVGWAVVPGKQSIIPWSSHAATFSTGHAVNYTPHIAISTWTYMDHWPMGLGSYLCNQPYIFNEWSLESKLHFMIMHDRPYINCFIVTPPIYNYKSEWFLVHVQHLGMISNVILSLSSYLCGICQLIMIRYQCAHRTV